MLKCLNVVFTSMFSMECVLKIIAFGVLVRLHTLPALQPFLCTVVFGACSLEPGSPLPHPEHL